MFVPFCAQFTEDMNYKAVTELSCFALKVCGSGPGTLVAGILAACSYLMQSGLDGA